MPQPEADHCQGMSTWCEKAHRAELAATCSCLPYRFLAEVLGLLEYKHDARSAIILDYAAAIIE
jgi:hypothetical protein